MFCFPCLRICIQRFFVREDFDQISSSVLYVCALFPPTWEKFSDFLLTETRIVCGTSYNYLFPEFCFRVQQSILDVQFFSHDSNDVNVVQIFWGLIKPCWNTSGIWIQDYVKRVIFWWNFKQKRKNSNLKTTRILRLLLFRNCFVLANIYRWHLIFGGFHCELSLSFPFFLFCCSFPTGCDKEWCCRTKKKPPTRLTAPFLMSDHSCRFEVGHLTNYHLFVLVTVVQIAWYCKMGKKPPLPDDLQHILDFLLSQFQLAHC